MAQFDSRSGKFFNHDGCEYARGKRSHDPCAVDAQERHLMKHRPIGTEMVIPDDTIINCPIPRVADGYRRHAPECLIALSASCHVASVLARILEC